MTDLQAPTQHFPMSYAVFKTGGKQYRVQKGDTIDVEKLDVSDLRRAQKTLDAVESQKIVRRVMLG